MARWQPKQSTPITAGFFCGMQVVVVLEVQPELWAVAEEASEAQGGVRGQPPPSQDDLVDSSRVDADLQGEPVLAEFEGLQKLLLQKLKRMYQG